MKIKLLAANQTEVVTKLGTVFVSYQTPVAICMNDDTCYRTEHKWSVTTTRHINKWLDGRECGTKPQSFFDEVL
jgi:hypothetical protein